MNKLSDDQFFHLRMEVKNVNKYRTCRKPELR